MNLTLPDWLALLGLVVGLVGGIVGIVGFALSLWVYGKTNEANNAITKTQAEIATTSTVLKTLVENLLGSAWAHVEKQSETMLAKLTADKAAVVATAPAPETAGGSMNQSKQVEDLETQVDALRELVLTLSDVVKKDIEGRIPKWAQPGTSAADAYLPPQIMNQIRRNLTVPPSEKPPES